MLSDWPSEKAAGPGLSARGSLVNERNLCVTVPYSEYNARHYTPELR